MGHSSQVHLWSGPRSTRPGNPHHHLGYKSTPTAELETVTGFQSLCDRKDYKLLTQAAEFKRLQDHQRLSQPTKRRLKRGSFIHQSRTLERRQEDIFDHDPKEIPRCLCRPCPRELPPSFGVPSPMLVRKTPKVALREYLQTNTQRSPWLKSSLTALLRMQFRTERKESTSSTQEAEKTGSAWIPASTPQTTKLKQKPRKQQQPHWSQRSCFSHCCPPYGCLVHPAGPSVKQGHWP